MDPQTQRLLSALPSLKSLGLNPNDLLPGYRTSKAVPEKKTNLPEQIGSSSKTGGPVYYRPRTETGLKEVSLSSEKKNVYEIKFPTELPIETEMDEILGEIFRITHSVTIISAPTGSGKTLAIPSVCATKGSKVRVAIPTTVAVTSAYNFIVGLTEMSVGFAASRHIQYKHDTRLVYGTTGHFVLRILHLFSNFKDRLPEDRKGPVWQELRHQVRREVLGDLFFIDEIHTMSVEITSLMGLISHLFTEWSSSEERMVYTGPRLVLASATSNDEDIELFFPSLTKIQATTHSFPVEIKYLDREFNPIRDRVDEEILRIIQERLADPETASGHGIVFRPGSNEVLKTVDFLHSRLAKEKVRIYPVFSTLPEETIQAIFEPTSHMKIIVGTNIIESSVTIKDVSFVIDDMLEKQMETSTMGGNRLVLRLISRSAAFQRKGRTGRTREGTCYRLFSEEQFQERPQFRLPEIARVPVHRIILDFISAGLNAADILYLDPAKYSQTLNHLAKKKYIRYSADETWEVTEAGKFVASLQLGLDTAYIIYLALENFLESSQTDEDISSLRLAIALACMLDNLESGYFFNPFPEQGEEKAVYQERKEKHRLLFHEDFRGSTDIHTLMNIYFGYLISKKVSVSHMAYSRSHSRDTLTEYSQIKQLNGRKMKELIRLIQDVESILLKTHLSKKISKWPSWPTLTHDMSNNYAEQIRPLFLKAYQDNVFVLSDKKKGIYRLKNSSDRKDYRISNRSFSRLSQNLPLTLTAAEIVEIVSDGRTLYQINVLVDHSIAE